MTAKKDLITSRIKKLLAHAKSAKELGSLHEAEMFAAKANELLIEHNISMFDVNQLIENEQFEDWQYSEVLSYKDNQASHGWRYRLCQVLCEYNFCNFTYRSYFKTLQVYGKMSNVDTVVWMYNFLSTALLRLAIESYKSCKKINDKVLIVDSEPRFYTRFNYLKDFCLGAVTGILNKLKKQRQQHNDIQGLILYNKEALEKFVRIENPDLKMKSGVKKATVGVAYQKGIEVGENINTDVKLKESKQTATKQLN